MFAPVRSTRPALLSRPADDAEESSESEGAGRDRDAPVSEGSAAEPRITKGVFGHIYGAFVGNKADPEPGISGHVHDFFFGNRARVQTQQKAQAFHAYQQHLNAYRRHQWTANATLDQSFREFYETSRDYIDKAANKSKTTESWGEVDDMDIEKADIQFQFARTQFQTAFEQLKLNVQQHRSYYYDFHATVTLGELSDKIEAMAHDGDFSDLALKKAAIGHELKIVRNSVGGNPYTPHQNVCYNGHSPPYQQPYLRQAYPAQNYVYHSPFSQPYYAGNSLSHYGVPMALGGITGLGMGALFGAAMFF